VAEIMRKRKLLSEREKNRSWAGKWAAVEMCRTFSSLRSGTESLEERLPQYFTDNAQGFLYPVEVDCPLRRRLDSLRESICIKREGLRDGVYGDRTTKESLSRGTASKMLVDWGVHLNRMLSGIYQVKLVREELFYHGWIKGGKDARPSERRLSDLPLETDLWQCVALSLNYLEMNALCCVSTQFLSLLYCMPAESNKFVLLF
jgi:hypothetical protein